MRLWLRSLSDFIIAVAPQWGVHVTGGFLVALVIVYEHLTEKAITGWQP